MSRMFWRYIDESNRPFYLDEDDRCIYIREYIEGGYEKSKSNQLIFNFKKPITQRGQVGWKYKDESIAQFVRELSSLTFPIKSVFVPMPSSMPTNDPEHDDRIIQVLKKFREQCRPDIIIHEIIDIIESIQPAHKGGPRAPHQLRDYIELTGNPEIESEYIFLLDDIITAGGHFKVCQHLLQKQYPHTEVIGVFWALRVFS